MNLGLPIQWTSVPGSQAYYLYVGTGVGLKDLIDTGEIQQTSYLVSNLPVNQTVYARIWTRISGTWYYADITFSGIPRATFTNPANGTANADLATPLRWTDVAASQAYYLYIGTAPGLKDIVDTGEIHQTSYAASNIPNSQTVYARIWTKIAGTWYYSDISYSGLARATFVAPTNGTASADLTQPIQWTSVANAQAYYLYVGTAPGLKDIVDSGELQQTSFSGGGVPANQTVYARIHTKLAGVWYFTDIAFSGIRKAVFLAPVDGSSAVDLTQNINWTAVPGAQAYYLYVGTSPGSNNIINSGEISQTTYGAGGVPVGVTVYARIHTKLAGSWYHSDIAFSGTRRSGFVFPVNGATAADLNRPIQWTSVAGAQAYYLSVGTAPGLHDIVDSGEIQGTSLSASPIPTNQLVYAKLQTKIGGIWYSVDISFTGIRRALLVAPTDGQTNVDRSQLIQWTAVAGAQAYYLYVGTAVGLKDLIDTGETQLTSRSASALPANQTVFARIWTKLAGVWYYSDVSFSTQ